MTFQRSVQSDYLTLSIHGTQVEYVQNFIYLGSMISWNNDCTLDSIRRIQLATVVYAGFRTILKDKNITVDIKLIFRQRVCSHFYYMLLIQGQLKRRWKKKWGVTEICIISTIRHKKLTLFGHICRMPDNRLLKSVLFGSMEGVRCRGRQPKRWLDSITEWTGLSIGDAVKMAQDHDVWRSFIFGLNGPWP